MKQETPNSIYLMHKYWGKKPSNELNDIVEKYSKENDLILDPFAGFGGIGVEAVLLNRNVIVNDLNPVSNFISKSVLETEIDLVKLVEYFDYLKEQYSDFRKKWYYKDNCEILTTLRNKDDIPIKNRYLNLNTKKTFDENLSNSDIEVLINSENKYVCKYWYPKVKLFKNSRICVKDDFYIKDLFPKRALYCNAFLYNLIDSLPDSNEKQLIFFAFTSNIANCSKLVPPIKSRGDMSQGAWMTGFYIGETYLENNVFHYFENRMNKVIKGKKDYLKLIKEKNKVGKFEVTNYDAKSLKIDDKKIDMIFTDFPYGDTVPYFEQSQLWNAWLKYDVDYDNEIVVSNSSQRKKTDVEFEKDISKSISEISRVLKNNAYFIFTFHSLSGNEWITINNAMCNNDFEFVDCKLMLQKTLPPRQLNRKKSIKGDMLVIYKKKKMNKNINQIDIIDLENTKNEISKELIKKCDPNENYTTNDLIVLCVNILLSRKHRSNNVDFVELINENFIINENDCQLWRLKNDIYRFK